MLDRAADLRPPMSAAITGLHRVLVDEFNETLWPSWVERYASSGGAGTIDAGAGP
jgi:hypothetical protein